MMTTVPIAVAVVLVAALAHLAYGAPRARYSGAQLDARYRLVVKQVANELEIGVVDRNRVQTPSGQPANPSEVPMLMAEDVLVRVKSEPMESSGPSAVKNTAKRYRITIEGVKESPEYKSIREVPAGDARAYLFIELAKLRDRAKGIHKDALYYGSMAAEAALADAGYFPGEISVGAARSKAAKVRVDSKTLQHKTLAQQDADKYMKKHGGAKESGVTDESDSYATNK